jgi:hypothetical protein
MIEASPRSDRASSAAAGAGVEGRRCNSYRTEKSPELPEAEHSVLGHRFRIVRTWREPRHGAW